MNMQFAYTGILILFLCAPARADNDYQRDWTAGRGSGYYEQAPPFENQDKMDGYNAGRDDSEADRAQAESYGLPQEPTDEIERPEQRTLERWR